MPTNDNDDWDADFAEESTSEPKPLQLNLKQEIKGIAANHAQEEEVWDDFFDGDEALLETPSAANESSENHLIPEGHVQSFLRLSSTSSKKRADSFATESGTKKFLPPYDRDLTELKYLIHCTPTPNDHEGSYEELSKELFYFTPKPVDNTNLQETIDKYLQRLRELSQEQSTVILVPKLRELESDITEELTMLEFQEDEEEEEEEEEKEERAQEQSPTPSADVAPCNPVLTPSRTPQSDLAVGTEDDINDDDFDFSSDSEPLALASEVPKYDTVEREKATAVDDAMDSLRVLAAQTSLMLAHASYVLADLRQQSESLQKALDAILQTRASAASTRLKALVYLELGYFKSINESNAQALGLHCKALRTLLLGECAQQHAHTQKCVSPSVNWHLLFAVYYGVVKTLEALGMEEVTVAQGTQEVVVSSCLRDFFPFFFPVLHIAGGGAGGAGAAAAAAAATSLSASAISFSAVEDGRLHEEPRAAGRLARRTRRETTVPSKRFVCSRPLQSAIEDACKTAMHISFGIEEHSRALSSRGAMSRGAAAVVIAEADVQRVMLAFSKKLGLSKSASQFQLLRDASGAKSAVTAKTEAQDAKRASRAKDSASHEDEAEDGFSEDLGDDFDDDFGDDFGDGSEDDGSAKRTLPLSLTQPIKQSVSALSISPVAQDDSEDLDWDIEMNIQTDVKEGAFAALIDDGAALATSDAVPEKAKLLEVCQNRKAQIVKYPPVSQLFTLKHRAQANFHQEDFELFLSQAVKKHSMGVDDLAFFGQHTRKPDARLSPFTASLLPPTRRCCETSLQRAYLQAVLTPETSKTALGGVPPTGGQQSGGQQSGASDTAEGDAPVLGEQAARLCVTVLAEYKYVSQLRECQEDLAWAACVKFFSALRLPSEPLTASEAAAFGRAVVEFVRLAGKMWCFSRQRGWEAVLSAAVRLAPESALVVRLVEQETYCHAIMDNDERVFDEWVEHGFEVDPVRYFCDAALREADAEESAADALVRALALSDLTFFLFSLSPLDCSEKQGCDEPFELVKECCAAPTVLNPVARAETLATLYRRVPLSADKAKVCLAIGLHSMKTDSWADAERQLYETVFVLDQSAQLGRCSPLISELGTLALRKFGEVLVHNGKYPFGVLCYDAAVAALQLRHKKESYALMSTTAALAAAHDDVDRAIAIESDIMTKYQREGRKNEAVFAAQTLAELHLAGGDFGGATGVLWNALQHNTATTSVVDSQKLMLRVQLALTHAKSYAVGSALGVLKPREGEKIPRFQRPLLLAALSKVYAKLGWAPELYDAACQLCNCEGGAPPERCFSSKEEVPRSWWAGVKYYMAEGSYRKALFVLLAVYEMANKSQLLFKARLTLHIARALAGLWRQTEARHYPVEVRRGRLGKDSATATPTTTTAAAEEEEEEEEEDAVLCSVAAVAQGSGVTLDVAYPSRLTLFEEICHRFAAAVSLFAAAGDARKEAHASHELVSFVLDYAFPSVALLGLPASQVFSLQELADSGVHEASPSRSSSSLSLPSTPLSPSASGNLDGTGDETMTAAAEGRFSVALEDVNRLASRVLDYASDTLDVQLLLEALLTLAETRLLEEKAARAAEFWKQWRELFFRVFVAETDVIGQRNPAPHLWFLRGCLQRAVRLLFALDRPLVDQNLFVVDALLNVERACSAVRVSPVDTDEQKAGVRQLRALHAAVGTERHAEAIWSGLYAMRVQGKKYAAGKLDFDTMQSRNVASFKAVVEAARRARTDVGKRDPSQLGVATKDYLNSLSKARGALAYALRIGAYVFCYSPSTGKFKVDRVGEPTRSAEHSKARSSRTITVRLSTAVTPNSYARVECDASLSVGALLTRVCELLEEGAFIKPEKKRSAAMKGGVRVVEPNGGFYGELRQLNTLLCQAGMNPGSKPLPAKFNPSVFSMTKPNSSYKPLPAKLPVGQCFTPEELKSNKLSLLVICRSGDELDDQPGVVTVSNTLRQYIAALLSAKPDGDVAKNPEKALAGMAAEMRGLASSLLYVLRRDDGCGGASAVSRAGGKGAADASEWSVVRLLCNLPLQAMPWELAVPHVVRATSLLRLAGAARQDTRAGGAPQLYTFMFDPVAAYDPKHGERSVAADVAQGRLCGSSTSVPSGRVATANYGRPLFAAIQDDNYSRWKKERKAKIAQDKSDGIVLCDLDCVYEGFKKQFTGKPVLVLTFDDLIDFGPYLDYFFKQYYHSVLFVPKYKQEDVVGGLLKQFQRSAEQETKGKSVSQKGTLLQFVETISKKYSVPLMLFN